MLRSIDASPHQNVPESSQTAARIAFCKVGQQVRNQGGLKLLQGGFYGAGRRYQHI